MGGLSLACELSGLRSLGAGTGRRTSGRKTECDATRHLLKSDPRAALLGACHFWGVCVPGCRDSRLDGQRKGVTDIVRSATTGRKHSSLAFQIFGKLGVPRKQRGGGGKRPLEFLKNLATVVSPLSQFDSWDQPLRAALVYFASLFIRTCDRVHTCQEIPGMKPVFLSLKTMHIRL